MSRHCTRRQLLAGLSTATAVAAAGCLSSDDSISAEFLTQVTIINGGDRTLSGSISVTDPSDETVLDESFEIDALEEDTTAEGAPIDLNAVKFEEVFTDTGSYDVAIQMDEGSAIEGVRENQASVSISDMETDRVLVGLADEDDGPIDISVVDGGSGVGVF